MLNNYLDGTEKVTKSSSISERALTICRFPRSVLKKPPLDGLSYWSSISPDLSPVISRVESRRFPSSLLFVWSAHYQTLVNYVPEIKVGLRVFMFVGKFV